MQRSVVDCSAEQQGVQLEVILDVVLLLALLHLVERRLRDVDVTAFDQNRHLPIEERQQQRAYVASIDVSVCHDDYAVIPQFVDVEIVAAYSAAERSDQRA